jgi:hypothetical protein
MLAWSSISQAHLLSGSAQRIHRCACHPADLRQLQGGRLTSVFTADDGGWLIARPDPDPSISVAELGLGRYADRYVRVGSRSIRTATKLATWRRRY